jgi:hypothetical protein
VFLPVEVQDDKRLSHAPTSRYTCNTRGEGMPNFIHVIHGDQAAGGLVASSREVYTAELHQTLPPRKRSRTADENVTHFSSEGMARVEASTQRRPRRLGLLNDQSHGQILVESGDSSNFMTLAALEMLGRTVKDVTPTVPPLVDFTGSLTYPVRVITLPVVLGSGLKTLKFRATFTIVKSPGPYPAMLGRTTVHIHGIVVSSLHQMTKFITSRGTREVHKDQEASHQYYTQAVTANEPMIEATEPIITEADPRDDERRPSPLEDLKEVELDAPEKMVRIDTNLPSEVQKGLIDLLRRYEELTALSPKRHARD